MLSAPAEVRAAPHALPFPIREDKSQTDSGYFLWSGSGKKSSACGIAQRMLAPVFPQVRIAGAHDHRFRHTLAAVVLGEGRYEWPTLPRSWASDRNHSLVQSRRDG